eukprot:6470403-Amphidinium_carterae.1
MENDTTFFIPGLSTRICLFTQYSSLLSGLAECGESSLQCCAIPSQHLVSLGGQNPERRNQAICVVCISMGDDVKFVASTGESADDKTTFEWRGTRVGEFIRWHITRFLLTIGFTATSKDAQPHIVARREMK